eukprot:CAMPEP_0168403028 /NCGR_PEP_ID=MMETSP0228-20121227/23919_1 /TAXON_ID=133427 /ORGANISM="Protoceratium reticulatum, Strain CCCM 535 (=CCMP 1889)" /LENGTH=344 /DNA_ID=CAMNT_0008416621 /DNA_START=181 /DNA_END=1211 /DNA_ORIENTATION=+
MNAVSIGVQTDLMARHLEHRVPPELRAVEAAFAAVFALELFIRIYVYRCRFFTGTGWQWNVFDTAVVGAQLAEEVLAWPGDLLVGGLSLTRLVQVVRLVRMVRFVRILRLVRELRMLVCSISSSLRPFSWTAALLLIMIFMVSLFITQVVADFNISRGDEDEAKGRNLSRVFGSLDRTMLSLFESITGGMDWEELVQPLAQADFRWTTLILLLYIAFSTLAIMNVVTGLFIESVLRHAKADKDAYLVNSVHEIFTKVDGGISAGYLTWEDFQAKIGTKAMRNFFKDMDINESEAKGLFCIMDLDGSGTINASEFLSGCLKLRGPAKAIDTAVIIEEVIRLKRSV